VNTNINFPQAPFLDSYTQRPSLPWLIWLQNPTVVSVNSSIGIPVTSGGTGLNTAPTNGQLLIGNNGNYSLNTLSSQNGISITNGVGTISVANTGVLSFKTTLSGLTPNVKSTGDITLSGTLGVSSGGTGANTLTGYVYGNGTSSFTASTTIPYTAISGGLSVTITTAKLTALGSNGSMTFTNGILTAQTQAT
jgi:hypothetical protein